MSDYNQENLSDMSKKLIENIPGELKKSMSTSETRSMPMDSREETPEDYQDVFNRMKAKLKDKKN